MSALVPEEAWPDPLRVLRRVLRLIDRALKGRGVLICAAALLLAAGWAATVDWSQVKASLLSHRSAYPVDAALLSEARRLGLDYETVSRDPSAHAGKPVLWCLVRQMGMQRYAVDGNLSWAVDLTGGDIEAVATGRMGVCKPTLAVVEKTAAPGIHLLFRGHP